jgi:hypothetical protein
VIAIYTFQFFYVKGDLNPSEKLAMQVLNGIVLAYFGYYFYEEICQLQYTFSNDLTIYKVLGHFLLDLWNLLDLTIILLGGTGIALRFAYQEDITVGRCFLAICSVLMYFKILYFLRPFSNSGPLGKLSFPSCPIICVVLLCSVLLLVSLLHHFSLPCHAALCCALS